MHDTIRRGSELVVFADVRDELAGGSRLDPDTITVTITRSDATLAVDAQAMTKITKGRYQYLHQTEDDDPVGSWAAAVTAVRDGRTSLSFSHPIQVVAA
jgi:hypothetical protein